MRYFNLIKNIKNWHVHFLIKAGFIKREKYYFKTRNGIEVIVPHFLLHTFKEVFLANDYFKGLPQRVSHPKEIKTIFDVGANVGFFSLFCANTYSSSRIYAFEPVGKNFELLKEQVSHNKLSNITPLQCALGDTIGEISLFLNDSDPYTTSASINENRHGNDLVTVEALSVEKFIRDHSLQSIDLLKLDCEGAEFQILYSLPLEILNNIKIIVMEIHGVEEEIIQLIDFLKKHNFETIRKHRSNFVWSYKKK